MTDDSQGRAASNGAAATNAALATAEIIQVSAKSFMFNPASITVKAGTTVTWLNPDDTQERFSFKFEKAGTYHYLCTDHPRVLGTIIVE
jgi:plastocyanin